MRELRARILSKKEGLSRNSISPRSQAAPPPFRTILCDAIRQLQGALMLRLQLSDIIKPNRDDKGICFTDYVDIYVCIYIYTYICVCVCVYVCVYMYTWPTWLLTGDWAPHIYRKAPKSRLYDSKPQDRSPNTAKPNHKRHPQANPKNPKQHPKAPTLKPKKPPKRHKKNL